MDAGNIAKGAAAGVAASVVQAAVGKAGDLLLLPPRENVDLAPRLVDRLAKLVGQDPAEELEWALGTAFHLGYGAMWGGVYAAVHRRRPVSPLLGGLALGGLIYGITFPRWGAAVQTGTERPPEARTDRMTLVAACVALAFGVTTALVHRRLTGPPGRDA